MIISLGNVSNIFSYDHLIHSHDGIYWRSDLMGHICKEGGLGRIGPLRLILSQSYLVVLTGNYSRGHYAPYNIPGNPRHKNHQKDPECQKFI